MSSFANTVDPKQIVSALNTETSDNGEVNRLHHIPRPQNKEEERRWLLEQMAGAFRIFAKLGFSDGSSGHISLRGMLALCDLLSTDKIAVVVRLVVLTAHRSCRTPHVLDQSIRGTLRPSKCV